MFKRQRLSGKNRRNRQQRQLGDNCPLIYALKGKEGLFTDLSSIKKLRTSFEMIVNHIAESEHNGYDLIVSMPSSYNISHMIAKRLASKFKAPHEANILRKITVDEAFRLLDRADVSVEETKSIDFRIKVQAKEVGLYGNFSLKGIPASLRNVLPPLVLDSPPTLHYQPLRVLLVDDLIASGTTLTTAVKIISQQYPYADIHAVCLFSSIG
ncbi:TPA: phosphoribosyltransferase [Providencia alcalifaciens]